MLKYNSTSIKLFEGRFEEVSKQFENKSFDLALCDPLYDNPDHINAIIKRARELTKGVSLIFMYPEDVWDLDEKPDQVIHWVKPISTKNTARKYSRFVEAIAVYDINNGPFNQDMYWANRSGIFTDFLDEKPVHPFEKPEGLIAKLIKNHSKPGQRIIDLCCGSGTTLKVAKSLNRQAVGIEMQPDYITIALAKLMV